MYWVKTLVLGTSGLQVELWSKHESWQKQFFWNISSIYVFLVKILQSANILEIGPSNQKLTSWCTQCNIWTNIHAKFLSNWSACDVWYFFSYSKLKSKLFCPKSAFVALCLRHSFLLLRHLTTLLCPLKNQKAKQDPWPCWKI